MPAGIQLKDLLTVWARANHSPPAASTTSCSGCAAARTRKKLKRRSTGGWRAAGPTCSRRAGLTGTARTCSLAKRKNVGPKEAAPRFVWNLNLCCNAAIGTKTAAILPLNFCKGELLEAVVCTLINKRKLTKRQSFFLWKKVVASKYLGFIFLLTNFNC